MHFSSNYKGARTKHCGQEVVTQPRQLDGAMSSFCIPDPSLSIQIEAYPPQGLLYHSSALHRNSLQRHF